MQRNHKPFVVGIFGGQGSGKTTLTLTLLANVDADVRWIFDYEGEFADELNLPLCSTPEEIAAGLEVGWVCFNPHKMFPDDEVAGFNFFCKMVFQYSEVMPGRKLVVIDELQDFVTGHMVPQPLRNIVRRGRRRGIDCVFMSQQPNSIHNLVQEQLTEVFCFQLLTDNSMAFMKEFRFDPDEIASLARHQWICRSKSGDEARSDDATRRGRAVIDPEKVRAAAFKPVEIPEVSPAVDIPPVQ